MWTIYNILLSIVKYGFYFLSRLGGKSVGYKLNQNSVRRAKENKIISAAKYGFYFLSRFGGKSV
jgi:hypothetical protein